MMVHEGIHLLLFVLLTGSFIGSNEELIDVPKETETANEGSCVTIPCTYEKQKDKTYILLWFKNPNYDEKSKMFKGTIVYSNTEARPQSPGYSSRVEYITDATSLTQQQNKKDRIKCELRITDLQKNDNGNYTLRMVSPNKYLSKAMNLIVTDNPCKVHINSSELQNPLQESDEFTVHCSTSDFCDIHPEWLVYTSEQKQEWTSLLSTDMITVTEEEEDDRKVTKLKLRVTWKDNNRILSCRPGKSEDSCQIRNITLSVEHAPKETKATVSFEDVKEGDIVTLSCTSRGRPDVSFTWFKKEKLEESQQMSDWKLIEVKPEHSGEYYCEAKNKYGAEESNRIKIDVKYGPQGVTVQRLVNINALKEGDKLTLKCSVQKGNPAVYWFTWYKKSQAQPETSETFIINSVTADDGGYYYCQANNGIQTAKSDELWVPVMYSPRNIKIEGTKSVKVGTTLTLTCSADAKPWQHRYTWKHTPGLSSFPLSLETGQQLNIRKVTIQHAGQYTCDVTNTIGTRSQTIKVDVLYPPSNLNLIMKREVREFEVISIICTVQSFPESHLTVTGPQGDLRNIRNNGKNSTESANKLSVYLNVTESDAGSYTCKAENQEGEQETKEQLTVLHPPKNVTVSSKGEQTFGSELTLTCEARSKPAPSSYEWKKRFNGQLKTVGHEQRLHFYFLEISDSGQYVCIAHNFIGNTESPSVEIKVKYAPNINIIHNMTIFAQWNWKLPVSLTCSADAYPPATDYKWYKQGDNTKVVSHQQSFTVWPQDPGKYYCSAANDIGKSRSEHIMLFSNVLMIYNIIFLLLILTGVTIFLIYRFIKKARFDQQHEVDPFYLFQLIPLETTTVYYYGSVSTNSTLAAKNVTDAGVQPIASKHIMSKNSQREDPDYEDVFAACTPPH